ncbi:hypothetical protein [Acinetobacter oleivorans]|uniref:hypothetical protein n=1 Tax=Acinetobacter oleivorans TaxID=1148157 RepID=UPI003A83A1FA
MIKEFALDPALLLHWAKNERDFREFFREYGRGTPRHISSFPKKKFSKLRSYLIEKIDSLESEHSKLRYTEMVQALADGLACRSCEIPTTSNWVDLVQIENQIDPFDTILSSSEINLESALTLDNMYSSELWNLPSQLNIKRTQEDFLKHLDSFVKTTTNNLVFIDAFCYQSRALDLISNLINLLEQRKLKENTVKVQIFYRKNSNSKDVRYVKSQILANIKTNLNIDIQINELQLSSGQDVFHNRYILNDCGGILLPYGFDLSDQECETDEAIILSKENYDKRWGQFIENLKFELVDQY